MKEKRTPGEVMWTALAIGKHAIHWKKTSPTCKQSYERMARKLIAAFKKL